MLKTMTLGVLMVALPRGPRGGARATSGRRRGDAADRPVCV